MWPASGIVCASGVLLTFLVSTSAVNIKCLNARACSGEGEFCSDVMAEEPGDGDAGEHSCECWNSYFKNETGGCYKPIFYDLQLRVNNRSCAAEGSSASQQSVHCKQELEAQLTEYINHSMPSFVKMELIQTQQQLSDSFSQQGSRFDNNHFRAPALTMPFIRVLAAAKTQLKNFDDVCTALENVSNATVNCNGSVKYAVAEVLCLSQLGNPCEAVSTNCHASGLVPRCTCRKGYRPIPGSQWACLPRCTYSEYWDESDKLCNAKCRETSCRNSGECIPTTNGHVCKCTPGYEGNDCSHWNGRKFEELKWITIGIGIATLVLILILVAVVSIACWTNKCQRFAFGHRMLSPKEDLERLSCFSAASRSVLKDYDTGRDTMEMTRKTSKSQTSQKYSASSDTYHSADKTCHRVLDAEKILNGVENESYIPEANYDLDATEDRSEESGSQHSIGN